MNVGITVGFVAVIMLTIMNQVNQTSKYSELKWMQKRWMLTVLWVCETMQWTVVQVCTRRRPYVDAYCCFFVKMIVHACAGLVCVFVRVWVCGWWSPRPSGARLPAVAEARLRFRHQKDEWCRAVAASAAGTAGVERDAVLKTHQVGFALAGPVWIHHHSTSSWGWTTSVTDGWWEGDISLLRSTEILLSPNFLDCCSLPLMWNGFWRWAKIFSEFCAVETRRWNEKLLSLIMWKEQGGLVEIWEQLHYKSPRHEVFSMAPCVKYIVKLCLCNTFCSVGLVAHGHRLQVAKCSGGM